MRDIISASGWWYGMEMELRQFWEESESHDGGGVVGLWRNRGMLAIMVVPTVLDGSESEEVTPKKRSMKEVVDVKCLRKDFRSRDEAEDREYERKMLEYNLSLRKTGPKYPKRGCSCRKIGRGGVEEEDS